MVVLNPKDISDQLQKMAVSIPGIRPGIQTTFYLKKVMNRLTVLGAVILALLATLPNVIEVILQISSLNGLSTTSLLIMAGVLVDISKEVDDIIYSNIYLNNQIVLLNCSNNWVFGRLPCTSKGYGNLSFNKVSACCKARWLVNRKKQRPSLAVINCTASSSRALFIRGSVGSGK